MSTLVSDFQRPSGATLAVLGNGQRGSTPSVLLSFFREATYSKERTIIARVFVNVGENTQRICMNHPSCSKLRRATTVLATNRRNCFECCIGLPGLVFELAGHGARELNVVGPRGIGNFTQSCQRFARRKHPLVQVKELGIDDLNSGTDHELLGCKAVRTDLPYCGCVTSVAFGIAGTDAFTNAVVHFVETDLRKGQRLVVAFVDASTEQPHVRHRAASRQRSVVDFRILCDRLKLLANANVDMHVVHLTHHTVLQHPQYREAFVKCLHSNTTQHEVCVEADASRSFGG